MAERWDAIVVGAGAMGTAAARSLAARGRRTVVLERFRVGHANGSSHGPNRIFRLAYHHPDYVRMARRALDEWRALEDEAGEELLTTTGGLDAGPGAAIAAEALSFAGEPSGWMEPAEVADRWPALRPPEGPPLLFQADAGVCRADRAVAAQARLAAEAGATVLEGTTVAELDRTGDGVEAHTSSGDVHRAPVVVVTAGAWAEPLLATAGIGASLRVTRERIAYATLPAPGPVPTLIEWTREPLHPRYALPVPDRPDLVKLGEHRAGEVVDPDSEVEPPVADHALSAFASERFPGSVVATLETCLYTNTPDEDFVLDRDGPVVVGSPCSGHGFKFAPLIGRILADLATGATPPVDLSRFALRRPSLGNAGP
ncbi:MAG: N-methyl-L-tryptophan oxidase [Actinomycetota bacterium]